MSDFSNVISNKIKTYNTYIGYCTSINTSEFSISEIYNITTGKITGTKTRVLNRDGAITGEAMALTLYLYDSKDRVIRSLSINHMGGEDLIVNKYDFVGNLVKSLQIHRLKNISSPPEVKLTKTFNYDHSGRLLSIDQNLIYDNIDKGTTRISELTYNDIGQLQSKKLNGGSANTLLQTVDYSYNIRGWLTSINNGTLSNGDFFGMNLCYETIPSGTNAPLCEPQFNGNISSILWKSFGDTKTNAYGYHYDGLNRLEEADYANKDDAGTWTNTLALGETDISYDKNGNILALKRYDNAGTMIDNLTYTYGTTNILQSVKDTEGNKNKGDYPGAQNQENPYTYDKNGNMISDLAKGISDINYNCLNLPEKIIFGSFGSIDYTYNAAGKKLRKKVLQGSATTYHHYIGGLEYLETIQGNYVLSIIHTEEGVINRDVNGGFNHTPILKDHLGSTRVVVNYLNNQVTVVQENNYYPFGLEYNKEENDNFNYLYNGKELQDEMYNSKALGLYDYGARFYDPQIGRWHEVDPLAEDYYRHSPYHFSGNNPIRFLDLNGMNYDDYKLRQDGKVEFVQGTNSKTDDLYATKTDGTVDKTKSVSVKKGTFNNSISTKNGNTTGFSTENVSDAKKVYKFAADNNQETTNSAGLEFGYIEYAEGGASKAAVVTDGKHNVVGATTMAKEIESGRGVVSEISHNHPRSTKPSGYSGTGVPKQDANGNYTGDAINAALYPNNSKGQPIIRTVYSPNNQTVYSYDKNMLSIHVGFFK